MQVLRHKNKTNRNWNGWQKCNADLESSRGLERHCRTLAGIFYIDRTPKYPLENPKRYFHLDLALCKCSNYNCCLILRKVTSSNNSKMCLASHLISKCSSSILHSGKATYMYSICWMDIGNPLNGMKAGQEISSNSFSEELFRNRATAQGCWHWFSHYWTKSSFRAGILFFISVTPVYLASSCGFWQ